MEEQDGEGGTNFHSDIDRNSVDADTDFYRYAGDSYPDEDTNANADWYTADGDSDTDTDPNRAGSNVYTNADRHRTDEYTNEHAHQYTNPHSDSDANTDTYAHPHARATQRVCPGGS